MSILQYVVEYQHTSMVQYFSGEPAYVNDTVLSGEPAYVSVTVLNGESAYVSVTVL